MQSQINSLRQKIAYQRWIRRCDTLTDKDRRKLRRRIEDFSNKPLISVILPVYNVEEKWLRRCIDSVIGQIYQNWELCIADDHSPKPHVRRVLEEYAEKDQRIKIVFRPENGHISAASNSALELAAGEFTALLDHDDELSEDALFCVAKEIDDLPEIQMIYSDEDLIDEKGGRFGPKFKPDWARDHFYSGNIVTHLSAYRTELLRRIGGFTVGLEGSQDYDLALRAIEQIDESQIRHIPRVLYHWRVIRGSVAYSGDEKPYAHEAARRAIGAHLERIGKKATVEETVHNLHRVRYGLPESLPKVSLILLSAIEDAEFCEEAVRIFRQETDYQNLEIALVLNRRTRDSGDRPGTKTIFCETASEAERYNNAVIAASGEILCFAEVNLRPLGRDWLREMVSFALQKEIGAIGAKLLSPKETIIHAGLLIGNRGGIGVAHRGLPREKDGYLTRARLINNFSALSVSCLMMRRELFELCGSFDAENFPDRLFDVDLCLKLHSKGFRNVFTPHAELIQRDGGKLLQVQRGADEKELARLKQRWPDYFAKDPFYNPNLSKRSEMFGIGDD